jgi:hypothetical protein
MLVLSLYKRWSSRLLMGSLGSWFITLICHKIVCCYLPATRMIVSRSTFSLNPFKNNCQGEAFARSHNAARLFCRPLRCSHDFASSRVRSRKYAGRTSSPLPKSETAEKTATGVVLIFDSEDGGMVAATRAVLDLLIYGKTAHCRSRLSGDNVISILQRFWAPPTN